MHKLSPYNVSKRLLALGLLAGWACGGDSPVTPDSGATPDAATPDATAPDGPSPDATPTVPECGTPDGVCIVFPLPTTVTDHDEMTIRGTADTTTAVAAIRVAGVDAQSTDGYASWRATVPLAIGENDVVVEREDVTGTVQSSAARLTVLRSPQLTGQFWALVFDLAGDRAYAFDRARQAIVEIQLSTGVQRHVVGVAANNVRGLAIDSIGNRLLVLERMPDALTWIDIATGARTVIADDATGSGPALSEGSKVILDEAGDRALVTQYGIGTNSALLAIDLVTGDRTIISDTSVGAGPILDGPGDMALDGASGRLFVADFRTERIVSVDLASGDRTVLTDASTGAGDPLFRPFALALDRPNNRLFVTDLSYDYGGSLRAVDLTTGDRTVISYRFSGPPFGDPSSMAEVGMGPGTYQTLAIAWDPAGNRVLTGDQSRFRMLDVDVATGDRTPIWGPNADTPIVPPLFSIMNQSPDTAVLAGGDQVASLELDTGRLSLISNKQRGVGKDFLLIHSVAPGDAPGRLVVSDWEDVGHYDTEWSVLEVDIASGNRATITPAIYGMCLGQVPSIAYHNGHIYGLSRCENDVCSRRGVYSYSFATDALEYISQTDDCAGDVVGTGPLFLHSMESLVIDGARDRALVLQAGSLVAVDLGTGDRSVVSDDTHSGPALSWGLSLDLDLHRDRAIVVDGGLDAMLAIDLVTGDRTVLSDATVGKGPNFILPSSVALKFDRNLALVTDRYQGVLVVDLLTGERALMR